MMGSNSSGRWIWLAAMTLGCIAILAVNPSTVRAKDPIHLDKEHGQRIAGMIQSQGAYCPIATRLKRTIVRLDGSRSYRVTCEPGHVSYLVSLPKGMRLR